MTPPAPPDAPLACLVPAALLAELDAAATEEGCDRATLVARLLEDALRVRALGIVVEELMLDGAPPPDEPTHAVVIPFPRPAWAVDVAD